MNPPELRERAAQALLAAADRIPQLTAFVGLDGFIDEILHVVDQREDSANYCRLATMSAFGARVANAAGHSTNIELVRQQLKPGGNGPITASALAALGLRVTCLGAFGYPTVHPHFANFARRVELHSIAEPGHTDALEFDDGKIMLNKLDSFGEITWANIQHRFGRDRLAAQIREANLVALVNWTMLPHLCEIWDALLREVCPALTGPRRLLFFDLADPEKRTQDDLRLALELIRQFEKYFDVTLGLNEKEARQVGEVLGASKCGNDLSSLAAGIRRALAIHTVVVHPPDRALAATGSTVSQVTGPLTTRPLITTGAGDHFNAGFCFGRLLGLDLESCLLLGVATSGHYVRTAASPSVPEVVALLRNWPNDN